MGPRHTQGAAPVTNKLRRGGSGREWGLAVQPWWRSHHLDGLETSALARARQGRVGARDVPLPGLGPSTATVSRFPADER